MSNTEPGMRTGGACISGIMEIKSGLLCLPSCNVWKLFTVTPTSGKMVHAWSLVNAQVMPV